MRALVIGLYAAILVGAMLWVDSRFLWLIYGPLAVAMLDGCCFRVFIRPASPRRSFRPLIGPALMAVAAMAAGGFVRKVLRIPIAYEEIGRLAVTAGLLWFLFESLCVMLVRWTRAAEDGGWRSVSLRTGASFAAVGPLAFFMLPLINLHPPHVAPIDLRKHFPASFEEIAFAAPDGVRLAGWWAESKQARGNVLMCHGHGQSRSQLAELLAYLQDRGYNVLAFDFRGHGASGGMSATFGSREIADVKAAADFARLRSHCLPLYLVGFSYGAIVSLQALPELGPVAAVWVDSPCGHFSAIANRYFDFLPDLARQTVVSGYDWVAWLDCGFRISSINPADALMNVRIPIHVSHCQGDPLIPYDDSRAMFDAYDGPKRGDWPRLDRHGVYGNVESKAYLKRLGDFFAEH